MNPLPYAPPGASFGPGRHCGLACVREQTLLKAGDDFRRPEFRREVFHRFYEFHTRHGTHPGCVYFLMPALAARLGWSPEQRLWFAYLNGNTQNPVTSLLIFRRFPSPNHSRGALAAWFDANYARLAFDTDRRYQKKSFLAAVAHYRSLVGRDPQAGYFASVGRGWPPAWRQVKDFAYFGRLSAWSYLEYLRIGGLGVVPDTLLLGDMSGSKSHRNGLAKVLGRDDLDLHKSNPEAFAGPYRPDTLEWLAAEGVALRAEAAARAAGQPWAGRVDYFTLESALCAYKSWHRPNRRYPNCYADMMYDRVKAAEAAWPGEDLSVFWELRAEALPARLLREANPADPGLCKEKQNHYRETGCPVMMSGDWACFANPFDRRLGIGPRKNPQGGGRGGR